MAQTQAVLPNLTLRPLSQTAGVALKQLPRKGDETFASLLDEASGNEAGVLREEEASPGSIASPYGTGRQAGGRAQRSTSEAAQTARKSSDLDSKIRGEPQTAVNVNGAGIFGVGAVQTYLAPEPPAQTGLAQGFTRAAAGADSTANSNPGREGSVPGSLLTANGMRNFDVAGVQTHLAPERPARFKTLAQVPARGATGASDTDQGSAGTAPVAELADGQAKAKPEGMPARDEQGEAGCQAGAYCTRAASFGG